MGQRGGMPADIMSDMATAAHSTHEPLAVQAWNAAGESDSKSERYLARRLAAAGADFKGVALIT